MLIIAGFPKFNEILTTSSESKTKAELEFYTEMLLLAFEKQTN